MVRDYQGRGIMGKKLTPKEQAVVWAMGLKRRDEFKALTDNLVPCVYAALAIALHEKGYGFKRINDLFIRSQEIWNEYCYCQGDMTDKCLELTGIDVMNKEVF